MPKPKKSPLTHRLMIRISQDQRVAVRREAKKNKLTEGGQIRAWMVERLAELEMRK